MIRTTFESMRTGFTIDVIMPYPVRPGDEVMIDNDTKTVKYVTWVIEHQFPAREEDRGEIYTSLHARIE